MHIAFWSPAWPLEGNHNGIITYVHAMKQGLEKRGHRVTVFTGKLDRETDAVHVQRSRWDRVARRVMRSPWTSFDLSSAISAAILREHRRNRIDVIEMEESFGWCADIQQRTGIPMVVKLHGPAFMALMGRARETAFGREKVEREGRALSRCETIIAPSADTLTRTMRHYGLTNKDTRVIPNPVVVSAQLPAWSLDTCDRNTVLFIGRFDLHKGADVVLKAMKFVWETHPQARLIFVGPDNGMPTEAGWKTNFLWYRDELFEPEERERISYLGPRPHGELAALRTSAMVTVVASRWENQPYTLMEAMIQGCPVVSTDAAGCPEFVSHENTGLLARSEDAEDFARQICVMLSDQAKAASLGRAAREHVLGNYSAERVVSATMECYERAISNR